MNVLAPQITASEALETGEVVAFHGHGGFIQPRDGDQLVYFMTSDAVDPTAMTQKLTDGESVVEYILTPPVHAAKLRKAIGIRIPRYAAG